MKQKQISVDVYLSLQIRRATTQRGQGQMLYMSPHLLFLPYGQRKKHPLSITTIRKAVKKNKRAFFFFSSFKKEKEKASSRRTKGKITASKVVLLKNINEKIKEKHPRRKLEMVRVRIVFLFISFFCLTYFAVTKALLSHLRERIFFAFSSL